MTWRRRFLAWVAPVLLLGQIALAIHQLDHLISPDAMSPAHECALCNVAGGTAPPPATFVLFSPDLGPDVPAHVVVDAVCCVPIDTAFSPRAPPRFVAL